MRADPLGDPAQQVIAELTLAAGPVQAAFAGRLHIPPDRLTVHPRQPRSGAEPFARSHSRSTSLISCTPTSRNATAALPDPLNGLAASVNRSSSSRSLPRSGWSHNWRTDGPMPLAGDPRAATVAVHD